MRNGKIWEVRMRCGITGLLIYCDKAEQSEAIEIGSGLLSVLSPKEIEEKFM